MNRLTLWSVALLVLTGFTTPQEFSFKDQRDGQQYKFTKIGELTVMTQNLAYDHEAAYCYQEQDHFCNHYGKLYDFQTAISEPTSGETQGICPNGWRIPNAEEWLYILRGLNGKVTAKRHNFISFLIPNNLLQLKFSGFKSHNENRFYQLGQRGFYMTSSSKNGQWTVVEIKRNGKADTMALHSKTPKERAISCRCIQNN